MDDHQNDVNIINYQM